MKTQNKRLEDLEKREAPEEKFYVIKMVLDAQSLAGEEIYKYENKETGEEELLTLEQARERFKDGTLIYIRYSDDWKSKRRIREDGDL